MAYLNDASPSDYDAVKQGASQIRSLKTALNSLIAQMFTDAGAFLTKWVTGAMIANDSTVDANRAIGTDHLKDSSVVTRVLASGAVTVPKVGYTSEALTAGATVDVDWSLAPTFTLTVTGNTTFTFSNAVEGQSIILAVTQASDGSHNYTLTWPGTVKWRGGSAPPALTPVAGKTDLFGLVKVGSIYYGNWLQNF